MTAYFYVFRVGGSHPRIKHQTLESAHTEALRLAAQHPGDTFEILQCLATTRTPTPQTFWMDGVIPPPANDESLLAALSSAFRNEGMDLYDKVGRGANSAADQRLLLRSEILKDISNAISRANAEARRSADNQPPTKPQDD